MSFRTVVTLICLGVLLSAKSAVFRTVADALQVPDRDCTGEVQFDFTGEVLTPNRRYYWYFHDATGGIEIHNATPLPDAHVPGSIVRIRGRMNIEKNGTRTFCANSTQLLRKGNPPKHQEATVSGIQAGLMDFKTVRLQGVFSSVVTDEVDANFCWASLRTAHGEMFLTFNGKWNDPKILKRYVDCEVSVTGLACPIAGLRRNLGRRVFVSDNNEMTLISPPAADPFAAPALSYAQNLYRQKAAGTALAVTPGMFVLQTAVGRILPVYPADEQPMPQPGDSVTVSGFATPDPYRIRLSDAFVRIDSHATNRVIRSPERSLRSLFTNSNGSRKIDSLVDGTFLTVRGRTALNDQDSLFISDGDYSISLDIPTLRLLGIPMPAEGSDVTVRGLCLCEFENPTAPTIYPVFKRFTLIPRGKEDLVVLSTPSWWTPFRLTMLTVTLGMILLGSMLWNVMLKRKSEMRGKELYEEKIDHALAEQKVEERTRLAVELHDSVSQTLTGVALQLDGGEIETAKTMLASCRGELRRCLWDLRSRTFEEKDMTEAITRTIAPHLNGCVATVRFNVPRERLSESLTHTILRIVRELVVNAIRHGRARHIRIAGELHGTTVSFSVSDDGCGFDPQSAPGPEHGHFGLLGIRERIEDFNGTLKIASRPDRGAKFTVTLTTAADETHER